METREEVDVGVQLARDEVLILECRVPQRERRVEQRVLARERKDIVGDLADDAQKVGNRLQVLMAR